MLNYDVQNSCLQSSGKTQQWYVQLCPLEPGLTSPVCVEWCSDIQIPPHQLNILTFSAACAGGAVSDSLGISKAMNAWEEDQGMKILVGDE